MRVPRFCRLRVLLRRGRECFATYLIGTGVLAALTVLCVGWPVYDAVAQVGGASDDGVLTVGRCIDANASSDPVEEAFIKEGILEEDLLQTKVTNGMCEDMLAQTPDGTPERTLVAAQKYIQEIELVEEAMRKAGSEAAAKGTNRHFLATSSSLIAWTAVEVDRGAADAQYPEPIPSAAPEPPAYEQPPGPGGGSAAPPGSSDGSAAPPGSSDGSAAPPGSGGAEPAPDGNGVTPTRKQAAAAASVGGDGDGSIAERLHQKVAAAIEKGASVPEARAGARCSLEVGVFDSDVGTFLPGMYRVEPLLPKKMRHRDTERAGLVVSQVTWEEFQKIRQKHEIVAETSKSNIDCVTLTNRMRAKLVSFGYAETSKSKLDIHPHQDDVVHLLPNQHARWNWDIVASQTGKQHLYLDLSYEISGRHNGLRFRPLDQPAYDGDIEVTPLQKVLGFFGLARWWLLTAVIGIVTIVLALATMLLWRRKRGQPSTERRGEGRI